MYKTEHICDLCNKPMKTDYTSPPTYRHYTLTYNRYSPLALPFKRENYKLDICSSCWKRILEYIQIKKEGDHVGDKSE